jgi:glycosidase
MPSETNKKRQPLQALPYRPHPHLYEINTWVWLEHLSRRAGRQVTLGGVPDAEWDALRRLGFDFIWLMGVWERSPESARLQRSDPSLSPQFDQALPGWRPEQVVGSPYAVRRYQPDPRIGTSNDLDGVREKLRARGMRLILDFVPNHTALDHPWVEAHPEYYIRGSMEDPRNEPDAFFALPSGASADFSIARGKDPYFPPWRDVAQLNLFHPGARAALLDELREIARHCDGVRCDMAMLILNDVFATTWSRFLDGVAAPGKEFWTLAVEALPDFVWLAEAYWRLEQRLQGLGLTFTYDKTFYDLLRAMDPPQVRAHLAADVAYQNRLARFLENHDEPRSAAVFGPRLPAVAVLASSVPGMRFYHQGQLEGVKIFTLIGLGDAAEEAPDSEVQALYRKILRIANQDAFHEGKWRLLDVTTAGDLSFENLIACEWRSAGAWKAVVVNLGEGTAQGRVQFAGGMPSSRDYALQDELNDVRYVRSAAEIADLGLYVRLDAGRAHSFDIVPA